MKDEQVKECARFVLKWGEDFASAEACAEWVLRYMPVIEAARRQAQCTEPEPYGHLCRNTEQALRAADAGKDRPHDPA